MTRPAPKSTLDGEPINDAPIRTGFLRTILYCCDPDTGGVRFGVDGCPCCPKSSPGGGWCGNGFCGADEDAFDQAEAKAQAKRAREQAKASGGGSETERIRVTEGTLGHQVETSQRGYPAASGMQVADQKA